MGGVLRGKEDSRDYMSNPYYGAVLVEVDHHRWQMVKIDSNRLIQGHITSPIIDFKLIGYTIGADPSFFASRTDVTIGTTGSWAAIDLSSQVDSDADGAILFHNRRCSPIWYPRGGQQLLQHQFANSGQGQHHVPGGIGRH